MNTIRKKHSFLSAAVIAALVLSGCSQGRGKKEESNKPQPQQTQPAPEHKTPPAPDQGKSTENEKVPEGQLPPIAPPVPLPTKPQAQQPTPPPADENLTWSQRLGYGIGNTAEATRNYLSTKAQQLRDSASALLSPNEDTQRRRDSMDATVNQSRDARAYNLDQLAREVAVSNPAPAEAVQAALHPNDETSTLLAALLTEPDPARMNVITSQLVDEVFNEPDLARAKVMKIQLGLRQIAANNLYDNNMARRVAFLQANLDERVKQDASAELLRDGLFVAGTSLAFGTVAGFRGLERLREGVHDVHPSRALSYGRQKLANAWTKTKSGARAIFRRGGAEAAADRGMMGVSGALRRITLSADEIASRNLRALGVSDDLLHSVDLMKVRRADVPYQEFQPTNLPGFKYAVLNSWDGADLGDQRIVVFSMTRWERMNMRPTYIASRKMSVEEANALEGQVRYVAPENGGKVFLETVDQDGTVSPTRLTEEEVLQSGEGTAESTSTRKPRSRKSRAEAQADGDISPTTAQNANNVEESGAAAGPTEEAGAAAEEEAAGGIGHRAAAAAGAIKDRVSEAAHDVASRTRGAAQSVAQRSRGAVSSAAAKIRPALRSFDTRWAATVAAGTAIPMLGFYYEGYDQGQSFGQGYETLYLESLIPQDRLKQITVDLSPDLAK